MKNSYKYISGLRPTPMIAYDVDPNENVWNDEGYLYQYGNYQIDRNLKHFWLINAYLILDESNNKVVAYKFENIESLVWLLRIINQELMIELDKSFEQTINSHYKDEFTLI